MRNSDRCQPSWANVVLCAGLGGLERAVVLVLLGVTVLTLGGFQRSVQGQTVRAVLFFSPTCQHCHDVITRYLPTLFQDFGGPYALAYDSTITDAERSLYVFHNDRLQFLLVDATKPLGTNLYLASNTNQRIPEMSQGVPRLVIGDIWLVGGLDIPQRTGGIVVQGLEQGGIGWPTIDGLPDAIASLPWLTVAGVVAEEDSATAPAVEPTDTAALETGLEADADTAALEPESEVDADTVPPARQDSATTIPEPDAGDSTEPAGERPTIASENTPDSAANAPSALELALEQTPSMAENFARDPVGNSFSVVILLTMIASIAVLALKRPAVPTSWGMGLGIPVLAVIGACVAGYLAYIEATGATAVCGPVGDCNTVNQSEYARLFGMLPVGALGLAGYAAILVAWVISKQESGTASTWSRFSILAMAAGGTVFSIYLTFLEPFVIGATCAWCLTSSVIIMALLWLSAGSGREALAQLRNGTAVD